MGDVIEFVPRFSPTDRQRELLRIHAWVSADMAYDDIEERGDDSVDPEQWWYLFDRLPECTYNESALWRRQMARSFDDLAEELDAGDLPRPRTIAEQLALALVIEQAAAALADAAYGEDVAVLAMHPRDHNWEALSDALLGAGDAGAFYDPTSAVSRLRRFPCDSWFTPGKGGVPRDPRRGFRR